MKSIAALLLMLCAGAAAFAQNDVRARIDSIRKLIAYEPIDSVKVRYWADLCDAQRVAGDAEAALEAGKTCLALARQIESVMGQAKCLNCLGILHHTQGRFSQALERYRKSVALLERSGKKQMAGALYENMAGALYNNMGLLYQYQSNYAKAIEQFHKSLELFEGSGNLIGSARALNNIGLVYNEQDANSRALEYFQRSLEIKRKIGNEAEAASSLTNIGIVYYKQGDLDRALDYFRQSLLIREAEGNKSGIASALSSIGQVRQKQGDAAGAARFFERSLNIQEAIGDKSGQSETLSRLANLKMAAGASAEARILAARSLALAREINAAKYLRLAAEARARADSALGDWKSAYEHYKLYKQYSDSLNNEAQSKEIGRLEAQYEFDKEIEERERLEAEAAQRRQMLYWIAAGLFTALLLVAGLLTWGYRTKRKANNKLASQNAEIIQQSEEISQQRDELQALNEQITEQRDILEKAHEEITDSIDYASRIQQALLPASPTMKKGADVFVYYKARDVVSGDFYWTRQINADTFLYAAVDCTGHGVPGAFMSVLGSTTLDTIVREYGETRPDLMLGLLDKGVRASLKQDENEAAHKDGALDGMDLALVKFDRKRRILEFSAAGRPLFLLRNGEILEYKGAKFPAGGAQHGEKTFPLETIPLAEDDRFFLFSDGITDQFGGPRGRKFSPRRLKETLLAHADKDLQAQGAAFAEVFDEWQRNAKQLDDQLLIGLGV